MMRLLESMKNYVLGSFALGWSVRDRPRVFYYQTKAYLGRFVTKAQATNELIKVKIGEEPLYFRDNWFDPRNICDAFENDYTRLDRDIFKNCKTFVDIGANIGMISRCAKRFSSGCRIFCFEPLEQNSRICKLNNPGARVETLGVGSKKERAEVLVDKSGFMASKIGFDYEQERRKIEVISLDEYFKDGTELDLIKMDVEGMELEALAGGGRTIRNAKRLVAEVHSLENLSRARELMNKYGFYEKNYAKVDKESYVIYFIRKNQS